MIIVWACQVFRSGGGNAESNCQTGAWLQGRERCSGCGRVRCTANSNGLQRQKSISMLTKVRHKYETEREGEETELDIHIYIERERQGKTQGKQ